MTTDNTQDNTQDNELRDSISSIIYGANWKTELGEDAHLPQTEAIMEIVRKHELQAVRDYILSLGWQETDNEYVAEVLSDCDGIAEELAKL